MKSGFQPQNIDFDPFADENIDSFRIDWRRASDKVQTGIEFIPASHLAGDR